MIVQEMCSVYEDTQSITNLLSNNCAPIRERELKNMLDFILQTFIHNGTLHRHHILTVVNSLTAEGDSDLFYFS